MDPNSEGYMTLKSSLKSVVQTYKKSLCILPPHGNGCGWRKRKKIYYIGKDLTLQTVFVNSACTLCNKIE
jgi:hypothetical protein